MYFGHRCKFLIVLAVLIFLGVGVSLVQAKKKEPPTKSIRGRVVDKNKQSIVGAKVFIRNVNKNTTTVLSTDDSGLYSIYGLDPKMDYEVSAEYGKFISEKKTVSLFLNRNDNVFNFELGELTEATRQQGSQERAKLNIEIETADHVKLSGDWYRPPEKKETKTPAVLLIHGVGEDRRIWDPFIADHLLKSGFAVLNIDLRGHGTGKQNGTSVSADGPQSPTTEVLSIDLDAAVHWLKLRDEVDLSRIALVGSGIGADLAFLGSGKFEEIRSAVALSGNVTHAKALVSGMSNFQPHSILYVATEGDPQGAESAAQLEKMTGFPVRVQIFENSGAQGCRILQEIPEATTLVLEWLKKTL